MEGTNGRRGGQFGGVGSGLVVVGVGFFLEGFWAGISFLCCSCNCLFVGCDVAKAVVW